MAARHGLGMPGAERVGGELPPRILLYDGSCGLCRGAIAWIVARDRGHRFWFAPLQGETAARLRELHPEIPADVESVVLVEEGRVHLRSKAVFHAARGLGPAWRWASWLRWLPASAVDPVYRLVARVRYRAWGRLDRCTAPAPRGGGPFLP